MNTKIRPGKYLMLLVLAFLVASTGFLLPASPANAYSYSFEGAPKNMVGVTKPIITFYFKTDFTQIPTYTMYLNGEAVAAKYDNARGIFTYTPTKDLASGSNTVRISIVFAGYEPIEQSWNFTVAKDAVKQFPAAAPDQLNGFMALNDYRVLYGLPSVKLNERLNASATAHAQYLFTNKIQQSEASSESLHDEDANKKAFIGKTPLDRGAYFGYTSSVGEDAAYHGGTISEAIDLLFDAPYHRNPVLNPYVKEVGIGKVGDYTVIEFNDDPGTSPQLVVSPAPGDRFVPTSFNGNERPDPLRIHSNMAYPVGYPIMAQYYGSDVKKVKLLVAELLDSSKQPVDLLTNTPDTDNSLSTAVIVLPRKPLQADSNYHVKLNLELIKSDGSSITEVKEWDFTTEPVAQIGKKKLHHNAADYKKFYVSVVPIQRTATFGLDDSSYQVDGVNFPMKRSPVIVDGSSYLYIRDLAAALGAGVEWNDQLRAAIYTKGNLKITLYTTKNEYEMNGASWQTATPAKLIGETTMVPVRLLAEVLGAKVSYLEAARTVKITY